MVAELRKYLKDIKATVEQFNNTEDFSHIVQNDNLISLDYINDLLDPSGMFLIAL